MTDHDDPRAETFGSLFVLVQHLTHRVDAALAPFDLTSRQWLLLAVVERGFDGRAPTLTEAAQRYGTSRQNVKAIAQGLERGGWVRLERDPGDGRATRIRLTGKVARFHDPEAEAAGEALLASAFAGLDPGDIRRLRALVVRMVTQLQHA